MIKISIFVKGFYCNDWPNLQVKINDKVFWDNKVIEDFVINLEIEEINDKNILTLIHHGKRFGEENLWDTDIDNNLDRKIEIKDIKFNGYSSKELIKNFMFKTNWSKNQLMDENFVKQYDFFSCNGIMTFNGCINLNFETPIENWLIMAKFKKPVSTNTTYYSGHDLRWHYDEPKNIIKEIKDLMNFD